MSQVYGSLGVTSLLDFGKVYVPHHLPRHWALTEVNVLERRIWLYDSLEGESAGDLTLFVAECQRGTCLGFEFDVQRVSVPT